MTANYAESDSFPKQDLFTSIIGILAEPGLHALPAPSNNIVFPGMARPDDLLASRSLA
jgi:hypothetical protein